MATADATIPPGPFRWLGPALIAIAGLFMLIWSWGTWPDPLVDFGVQLYVPWQLVTGHVLYRDITYYNGPLSEYFNAAAFSIFGVGLNTLVWVNLVILVFTIILAYRLTVRASGRLSATMTGLTFVLVSAFGQVVRLGNYNWVTPYHHELTHGAVLAILAIACLDRYRRTGKNLDHPFNEAQKGEKTTIFSPPDSASGRRGVLNSSSAYAFGWLAVSGVCVGAAFLTKAEPSLAAIAAVGAQLLSHWWIDRASPKRVLVESSIIVMATLAVPLIAWALLAIAMPAREALLGVLGSWPWALDRRITSLHFYREVAGLNDVHDNLLIMAKWSAIYAALMGIGVGLGLACRSSRHRTAVIGGSFAICTVNILAWRLSSSTVSGMLTPLPICLAGAALVTAKDVWQRRTAIASLRFALVVFAAALVGKMGLATFAYHYGFVLAWPATAVLVCAVTRDIPAWVDRHGGAGQVVRSVGLSAWLIGVGAILFSDHHNFEKKKSILFPGTPDEFRGDGNGVQVQIACEKIDHLIPKSGTVMVLPQGLMINYLTRRASPSRYENFMPPEVLAVGEQTILDDVKKHPPDVIVLNPAVMRDGFFTLDDRDAYGAETYRWVLENYVTTNPADPLQIMVKKRP